ncbi:hypothetical protein AEYBE204_12185 [Asticcacaulis sp. YBE204]|nr:hypothetical protein AEYBE204_12185 [Asticcacaulis sp. YBE204]
MPTISRGQDAPPADYVTTVATAAEELRSVDAAFNDQLAEDELNQLRLRVSGARSTALDAVETMQKELELVSEREAQLGPKPGEGEPPDILAQRQDLTQRRGMLEAAIKRGRLVAVEAQQLADRMKASRAEQISTEVAQRVQSPLLPRFWVEFANHAGGDIGRLSRLIDAELRTLAVSLRGPKSWIGLAGFLAALTIEIPLRLLSRRLGQTLLLKVAPEGRIRRSAYALWRLVVETGLAIIAVWVLTTSLRWASLIHPRWEPIIDAFSSGVGISAYLTSLAGAVLMRGQKSWRLLPIEDDLAGGLRRWTWLLAGLSLLYMVLQSVSVAMSASAPAMSLMQMFIVSCQVVLFAGMLVTLARLRLAAQVEARDLHQTALSLLRIVAWLVILISLFAMLAGYVALGLFTVRIVSWALIIGATYYLTCLFADDLMTNMFCSSGRIGRLLVSGLGVRSGLVDQAGIVLSALLRISLTLIAVAALLFPFGTGFEAIVDNIRGLADGITIGEFTLSPGAIGRALLVFMVGVAVVRLLQSWLENKYLPRTAFDAGARNSISLITRYAAFLLVILWTLASLGIGVERIALLLSALSVGIGFGLQAITQNFVSGLILLAERPVKIGDLIRVGNDEGDVRRINVRSTEIELGDHSTLIVPNSELITKSVLNKTHANPLGRIQIEFSVPIGLDITPIRGMVLAAFQNDSRVLAEPEPSVFIDGIADGRVRFNCFAHVAGPRDAYGARSSILIDLLQRFYKEGIDVGTVPQKLELTTTGASLGPASASSGSDSPK